MIVVGNKNDLEIYRQVQIKRRSRFSSQYSIMNQESSFGFSSFLLSTMGFVDQLTRLLTESAYFCLIGFRVIETSAADRQDSVDRLILLIIKV